MTITTYDELKVEIASWLHRTDIDGSIPTFIQFAEAHLNRKLRTTEMETRSQATADSEFTAVPDDYLQMREIHLEDAPDKPLKYITPQELTFRDYEQYTGTPFAYTIVDSQIKLYPAPTVAAPVVLEIIYIQKIPALSDSNTTNWLLDSHPDLYFAASMLGAEAYIVNDKRLGIWKGIRDEVVGDLNNQANKTRIGTGPLIPRVRNVV